MSKIKTILLLFAFKIFLRSMGLKTTADVPGAPGESAKTNGELQTIPTLLALPTGSIDSVIMMQNQHLAGILLAMGCPPKEAEIRSEIFAFKDMPMVKDKMYFFPSRYWVDV